VRKSKPSSTAQNIALARAHLTWQGILDDPWAETMLRPWWATMGKALRHRMFAGWGRNSAFTYVAARTRFYDDAVTRAIDDGITQVVVIAAGYDSRAWRLARPGVTFFEVDHPATQTDKRDRAPEGGPTFVPVDFAVDSLRDCLTTAGFEPHAATIFTLEGLTVYLTEQQVRELLRSLRALSGPGSRLAVNFGLGTEPPSAHRNGRTAPFRRAALALQGEPIVFRLPLPDAPDFVAGTGWAVDRLITTPDLIKHYLPGMDLPARNINPTAYAVEAALAG
jgi:methyltransferase (TIGR00027 family)